MIWPIVVKTKEQIENEPPVPTHNEEGTLTRHGALVQARAKYGDLGTISSDERMPLLVWKIGEYHETVGRGRTWEQALSNCRPSKKPRGDI